MKTFNFLLTLFACLGMPIWIYQEICASAGNRPASDVPHWFIALIFFSVFTRWVRQLVTGDYT